MEIITEFRNWLTRDSKSPKTIENYTADLKGFLEWKGKEIKLAELQRTDFRDYFQQLREKGYAVSTINNLLNKLGAKLGMKIYPHKFRHTCFTMLIRKGVDSELAGHASIETTHTYYLSTSKEEKAKAVELL